VTIGDLAGHLLIRHNSAVELVDRLVRLHLVTRLEAPDDKRRVVIALTPKAETILETLSAMHLDELRRGRALLLQVLNRLDAPHSR
jgi:DNA-binding MarR family transcriptional regulator